MGGHILYIIYSGGRFSNRGKDSYNSKEIAKPPSKNINHKNNDSKNALNSLILFLGFIMILCGLFIWGWLIVIMFKKFFF